MIKKYLNLPFKSILKQGSQSIISAFGLAIALTCSILILLYVQYEFSYDNYHENSDQIYRVVTKQTGNTYMGKDVFAVTPGTLKEALINEIPEIKDATKCTLRSHIFGNKSNLFEEYGVLYADEDFLKIFSFPIVSGNPMEELKQPFTLFMTKEMASKYFGNEDPVGKTITADNKYVFTVKGIIENIPSNSHIDFDFITGFETFYSLRGGKENVDRWGSNSYQTYYQLKENVNPESIKRKLDDLYTKYNKKKSHDIKVELISQSLKDIHLSGEINFDPANNNDIRYIFLVISIGIMIILIASFNYMNMAIARSFNRGREIGILKVAGSSKLNLIFQIISESVLLTIIGLIIALILVWFLIPIFGGFTDRPLSFSMIFQYSTIIWIIALVLFVGLFAGIYPAIHLSSISPLQLIKGDFKNLGGKKSSGFIRNILVVLQYIISIVALISSLMVMKQMNFLKNTDPGFVKDNILTVYLRDPDIRKSPEFLMNELRKNIMIIDVVNSANLPITIGSNSHGNWEGKPEETNLSVYKAGIGYNFIDFYNLKIVSGRGFSIDYPSDTVNSFIINQTASKIIGWDDPVGKKFGFNKDLGVVVGEIKDFYFHSLHLAIEPLALSVVGSMDFRESRYISIKVTPGSLLEAKLFVETTIKNISPHYLNPVTILSDRVDEMYSSDRKLATIILASTILAVILTCLGQYSLSSYTIRKRSKEMAIRKVNGAKPITIMALLIGEVTRLVLIAILFAWPISYYIMNKWLQNFSYRIEIGPGLFIYSALVTLLISLAVISYHVIKLSKVNPADIIRYE